MLLGPLGAVSAIRTSADMESDGWTGMMAPTPSGGSGVDLDPRPSQLLRPTVNTTRGALMASYDLTIPRCFIGQFRGVGGDQLYAATSLRVMNVEGALHNQWDPIQKDVGWVDTQGRTGLGLTYSDVDVPDATPDAPDGGAIYWSFILVNKNAPDPIFRTVMDDAVNAVVGALIGTGNIVPIIVAGALEGAKALADQLLSGCDGVVSAQEYALTATQLSARTNGSVERWDATLEYPGTSTGNLFCGAASDYFVDFSIARHGKPKETEKNKEKDKDKDKEGRSAWDKGGLRAQQEKGFQIEQQQILTDGVLAEDDGTNAF
jgi:hypothetical protein